MYDPASVPLFRLEVARLRRHFTVLWLRGIETISQPYAFELEIVNEGSALDPASLMYRPAFISFKGSDQGFHGLILALTRSHYGSGPARYRLQLGPRLSCLGRRGGWRVFQHLSATQIVTRVLQENGMREGAWRFESKTQCREREFCTQHQESDLHLVQRLLRNEGLHYHFRHSRHGHVLVIGEGLRGFERSAVAPWRHLPDQAGVTRFCVTGTSQASLGGRVGERAQGASTLGFVRCGQLLPLVDHPVAEWNHMWLVTQVSHSAGNAGDGEPYINSFQAIPWEVGFNAPLPPPRAPAPGLRCAWVVGRQGEEVERDRYRRVCVRFDQVTFGSGSSRDECWLSLAPGLDLPIHGGTPVAVGFLGGDIDRPLIVAGFQDRRTSGQSPVSAPDRVYMQLDPRMWLGDTHSVTLDDGPTLKLHPGSCLTISAGDSELRLDADGLTLTSPQIGFCNQPHTEDRTDSAGEPAVAACQAPGDAAQREATDQREDQERQP